MDQQPSLRELFDLAAPDSLRRSLSHVFFDFLINNKDCLPADFETITGDFYVLLRFLNRVERQKKKEQTQRDGN